jgi:ADP-ribosyl-[dinitrogen reductase] hydrolase
MEKDKFERLEGGLVGLVIGDAVGVPYEFKEPFEIPAPDRIDMQPPHGFFSNHGGVLPGTWSDDTSQALCLFASLRDCGGLEPDDLAQRLVAWMHGGYMAVDKCPFDVGFQTCQALTRYKSGIPADQSGLKSERNNGNGSLMRVLPLALLWEGDDASLVDAAHRQSIVTHAHPRSQVCCALYCLWARFELEHAPSAWEKAAEKLRSIYGPSGEFRRELDEKVRPEIDPESYGGGYVVTCLKSARKACMEPTYELAVKKAISFGVDTDTTASVTGGIAGIQHGINGIPERWWRDLRGKDILVPLLESWHIAFNERASSR